MFLFKEDTPLMEAARAGHLEIVKLLLNQGANANDTSKAGKFLILFLSCRDNLFHKNIITI